MRASDILWRALAAAIALAAFDAQAVNATIYPSSPLAGESFVVYVSGSTGNGPYSVASQNVTVNGSDIVVNVLVNVAGLSSSGNYGTGVVVPGVGAGTSHYVVNVQYNDGTAPAQASGTITVAPFSGASTPFSRTLSANWFSDDESGWGINIVQGDSGQLFGVWATYAPSCANGPQATAPWWLVMSNGQWVSPTMFRGLLYQTAGSSAHVSWNPAEAGIGAVGVLSLQFVDGDHVNVEGDASYICGSLHISSIAKSKLLHRLKF